MKKYSCKDGSSYLTRRTSHYLDKIVGALFAFDFLNYVLYVSETVRHCKSEESFAVVFYGYLLHVLISKRTQHTIHTLRSTAKFKAFFFKIKAD